jgi:rubredoxin
MSADNWAECPQCKATKKAEVVRLTQELNAAYGKVTPEVFMDLNAHLQEVKAALYEETSYTDRTFREDYEITGGEDGVIYVDYSGGCRVCGLETSFQHLHAFYPVQAP